MDENDLDDPSSHSTSEGPQDVNVSDELGENKKHEIKTLLLYSDVLTDSPGLTNLAKHVIRLTRDKPVRAKPYPLPFMSREIVCKSLRNH